MQPQKQNDLSSFPKQIIYHHSNPSLCHNYWCQRSWLILWGSTRPSRANIHTHTKRCPFHHKGFKCTSRKSRNTKITGKFGLGVQNWAGQRLMEFCQDNILVIPNTFFQQPKRWLYTQTSPDGEFHNQICSSQPKRVNLCRVSENNTWNRLWLSSWVPYFKIQA